MKKWLIAPFLVFILFPKSAFAETKLDNAGNYYVKNGYCTYTLNYTGADYKFRLNVKDAEFSDITFVGQNSLGDYGKMVFYGSLKYGQLFKNKVFSCPEEVYVQYIMTKPPIGYYMQSTCDADRIGTECFVAELEKNEMVANYLELDANEQQTEVKNLDFACSYSKITTSINGTKAQNSSAKKLMYKKFTDGTEAFYSGQKVYDIDSESITINNCDNIDLYLKVIGTGNAISSYKIVSSCSESEDKCVIYRREDLDNTTDSSMREDGTSANAPELADPDLVKTSVIKSTLDLNIDNECGSYLGNPDDSKYPAYYLSFAFDLMKYAAILILFGMTAADFTKAMATKEEELKKTLIRTIKRLVIIILIFFLPYLIEYLFELFGIYTDPSCVIKK